MSLWGGQTIFQMGGQVSMGGQPLDGRGGIPLHPPSTDTPGCTVFSVSSDWLPKQL